ncbi:hypothetical protein [Sulfitobacter sp. 1A13679]|uniref:hypothetical protein n=1 Tax=Sulfitobacter sp. 1A13679 TaxID=3368597 RepID=UPI0037477545
MGKIDIMKAIAPKSDQLNADDLIGGPRVIRINAVHDTGAAEQSIHIRFDGDDGRPWKPSKTALRVMVAIWGDDPDKWVGLHIKLFNDEKVKWAGKEVGGIRILEMEGLSKPRTLQLTTTRGKRSPTTIQPLNVEKKSGADDWKARLFAVAEGGKGLTVDDAWSKVPADVKAELGDGLYDQLIALETAAQDHIKNDPGAAADALNDSLS